MGDCVASRKGPERATGNASVLRTFGNLPRVLATRRILTERMAPFNREFMVVALLTDKTAPGKDSLTSGPAQAENALQMRVSSSILAGMAGELDRELTPTAVQHERESRFLQKVSRGLLIATGLFTVASGIAGFLGSGSGVAKNITDAMSTADHVSRELLHVALVQLGLTMMTAAVWVECFRALGWNRVKELVNRPVEEVPSIVARLTGKS